ncbi:MAG: Hsp20/alpha crystallin family protein [Desulfomonile tiedjei]|uniref:Hsp20/alpha crystallin family protein n=1 Tax=Desulfomonile tiedjei TaxID=2358 RepID=A0A9D6V0E6_9BACT|nr:Hsp20/alpha crystallin family protein [Desulfomonile tiedjei]
MDIERSAILEQGSADAAEASDAQPFLTPAVDVYETEDRIVMLIDLPGVVPSDVDIDLQHGVLTILAKAKKRQAEGRCLLLEYSPGNYFRSFHVTDGIDGKNTNASLSDGVLTIVFPKSVRRSGCAVPIIND